MDVFFLLLHNMIYDDFVFGNPYWATANEKSSAAMDREETAVTKFDYLRSQMNMALRENTRVMIGLGCRAKSHSSPLRLLPSDVIEHILEYVGMERPDDEAVSQRRSGLAILPYEGWRQRQRADHAGIDMDLTDMSLYNPGEKISIPFSKPDFHLTGPCYRDFRRHINQFPSWSVKRIAATTKERRKVYRKGTVYFVNIIYNVPGRKTTKRKRGPKLDPVPEPLLPKQQKKATRALEAAVESAGINRGHWLVDPVLLQRAEDAGYSKRFVLVKVSEHWNTVKDTKPPAKKIRKKRK